nr:unnamed protein product [Callosobruchus chinensis]
MAGCVAVNCSNSAKKGFLMNRFPRDPVRTEEWLIKNVHFSSEMWEKTREDGTRKLKANAVPTVISFSQTKKATQPPIEKKIVNCEES